MGASLLVVKAVHPGPLIATIGCCGDPVSGCALDSSFSWNGRTECRVSAGESVLCY
jgi:hypothetical protein